MAPTTQSDYLAISKKAIARSNNELIKLHKRVIRTWLLSQDITLANKRKFFIIYDHYIDEDNIRCYFHLPMRVFAIALLTDTLEDVKTICRDSSEIHKNSRDYKTC